MDTENEGVELYNTRSEDIKKFVKGLYKDGRSPCEHFGMTPKGLSKLERNVPELTCKTYKEDNMFTKKDIEILKTLDPYLEFQETESRKGRAQGFPVFTITKDAWYWCDKRDNMVDVPEHLIGDFILTVPFDEEYTDFKDIIDYNGWKRAEYKEVKVMKWVAKDD